MSKHKGTGWNRLVQHQKQIRGVATNLTALAEAGLIELAMLDKKVYIRMNASQAAMVKQLLSHPEAWPDNWSDETMAMAYEARDKAIEKGVIEP
jgi:hypothetical protein